MSKNINLLNNSTKNLKENKIKMTQTDKPFDFPTTKKRISKEDNCQKKGSETKNIALKKCSKIMTDKPNPEIPLPQKPHKPLEPQINSHFFENQIEDWLPHINKNPNWWSTKYKMEEPPRMSRNYWTGMNFHTDPGLRRRRPPERSMRSNLAMHENWKEEFCLSSRLFEMYKECKMIYERKESEIKDVSFEMRELLGMMENTIEKMRVLCTGQKQKQLMDLKIKEFNKLKDVFSMDFENASFSQKPSNAPNAKWSELKREEPTSSQAHLIESEIVPMGDGKRFKLKLKIAKNWNNEDGVLNLGKHVLRIKKSQQTKTKKTCDYPKPAQMIKEEAAPDLESGSQTQTKRVKKN